MFKRLLLALGFLAVAAGIAFAIYWLFFRAAAPTVPTANVNANVPGGGLPTAINAPPTGAQPTPTTLPPGVTAIAQGGVTLVTPIVPATTIGASVSATGALDYYNRNDGKFYRMNANGTVSPLSDKTFYNVSNATFASSGNKAIIEYPDGSKIYFDFSTGQQVTLPKHWEDFSFNPTGTQIVAKSIAVDSNNRFLVVSNPDGSAARAVQELGDNADKVITAWSPNNQVIATAATGRTFGADSQEIYLLGQHGENFKSLTVEGLDFRPLWTPSGQQLLYSAAGSGTDWKPSLWVVDGQGDNIGRNRKNLNVNTWADKCTFATDTTLYCAVPQSLPRGAGLQPDVANDTPDNIFRIDLTTGLQTQVAIPEGSHTIGKIMLTPDRTALYFVDQTNGTINKIQLQ